MQFDNYGLCIEVMSPMWNNKEREHGIHHIAQESSKELGRLSVNNFTCKGVLLGYIQAQ